MNTTDLTVDHVTAMAPFTTEALIDAIIRLTHEVHGTTNGMAAGAAQREQRALLRAEVLRRSTQTAGPGGGDAYNITAAALAYETAGDRNRNGDRDELERGARMVWSSLIPPGADCDDLARALTAAPESSPDVYAYTTPF